MVIKKIKSIILQFRIKVAIKEANKLASLTKHKYLVILYNGKPSVYRKQDLKLLIKRRIFKKGITIEMLEKKALYKTI